MKNDRFGASRRRGYGLREQLGEGRAGRDQAGRRDQAGGDQAGGRRQKLLSSPPIWGSDSLSSQISSSPEESFCTDTRIFLFPKITTTTLPARPPAPLCMQPRDVVVIVVVVVVVAAAAVVVAFRRRQLEAEPSSTLLTDPDPEPATTQAARPAYASCLLFRQG